jgi:hypothetical protein
LNAAGVEWGTSSSCNSELEIGFIYKNNMLFIVYFHGTFGSV